MTLEEEKDRSRRKPAWRGERMELDSRKSRRDSMMRSKSFEMQEVREIQ